jgi:hypothetical protein
MYRIYLVLALAWTSVSYGGNEQGGFGLKTAKTMNDRADGLEHASTELPALCAGRVP